MIRNLGHIDLMNYLCENHPHQIVTLFWLLWQGFRMLKNVDINIDVRAMCEKDMGEGEVFI